MSDNKFFISLSKVGGAIGRGLIAGLAGTVAITISQMIEMKLSGRGSSDAPMKVAGKALGVEPRGKADLEVAQAEDSSDKQEEKLEEKAEANKEKFSQLIHFAYGTSWGVARGMLDLAGLRGAPASLVHFGAVWGTALVMLPAAGAAKPVTKWPGDQLATDILHHAVYAAAAGAVYDAMPAGSYGRKRKWNIFS
jgi:hypothetical protein